MIFDLTVPGAMGGVQAVRDVREAGARMPVFVASGYADDPAMASPEKFGFTASIRKPFRKAELARMLERHLGHEA
jgi:FixJ family two-component response regulator